MRTTHLMFLLPLAFLIYPMRKKGRFSKIGVIDYIWFVLTLAAMTYISQISYSAPYRAHTLCVTAHHA